MAKRRRKAKSGWKVNLLIIGFLLVGVVFSSIAIVLVIGMLPTFVAGVVDQSKGKIKTLTVGAMNFAGCAPFLIEIWKKGGSFDVALTYLTQPRTVVVMFFAAGMGYLIDWAMTGIVSSIMVQRAKGRLKEIDAHQKVLIERWGPEVSGTVPLDEFGFVRENFSEGPSDGTQEATSLKLP